MTIVDREMRQPRVSILMPTYKHESFIRRALGSLREQTFADWELIIIDDGSPDATETVVHPYLADPRIRYHRLKRNGGLGAALNLATGLARGQYIAYLPSDDIYYPGHLEQLVATLDAQPDVYLAYSGVRWASNTGWRWNEQAAPTLQGATAVGREAEVLAQPLIDPEAGGPLHGNLLAPVQVLHRRDFEATLRWVERGTVVSDRLERDFWRAMLAQGARFVYTGAITCEWTNHPEQRHRLIAGHDGGLSHYRSHYELGRGELINFQPSFGMWVDERARYGGLTQRRDLPAPGGLKILLVGELGFNPERILAFEERGHKLYGLWYPQALTWDTTGPLPFGNVEDISYDRHWAERVRAIQPDVIYALLNWHALPIIDEVLQAELGIPFVFHFKEGPEARFHGLWPALVRALTRTDSQVFINRESFEWFQHALDGALNPDTTLIIDGDLPKIDWMSDDWSPKLSAQDGQIHTVCSGRPIGLSPFSEIAEAGIHIHFYGETFQGWVPDWLKEGLATNFLHLHPTVDPIDWVKELSQYDAGWCHVQDSSNQGNIHMATWNDLNLPARLGTYAAAGLPWIMRDNRPSHTALQRLAQEYDIGLFFKTFGDLGAQLRDRPRLAQLTANMRAARYQFAFDTHVDALIALFLKLKEAARR